MVKKAVSSGASSAFGVYLIHTHPLVYEEILHHKFDGIAEFPVILLVMGVLFVSLSIYVGCTVIDMVRIKAFECFRINKWAGWLEKRLVLLEETINGIYRKEE